MRKYLIFTALIINVFTLFGQPILTINNSDSLKKMVLETVFFDDKMDNKTLKDLQGDPSVFSKPQRDFYAIGASRANNIWIKFQTKRLVSEKCFIELSFIITDTVFLYAVAADGTTTVQHGGKFVPFAERLFKNNHFEDCFVPRIRSCDATF